MYKDKRMLTFLGALCFATGVINFATVSWFLTGSSQITGLLGRIVLFSQTNGAEAIFLVALLISYCIGCVVSGVLFDMKPFDYSHRYTIVFASMSVALAIGAFTMLSKELMVPFYAFLLGVQNALSLSYRGIRIRTTHFTGYITDFFYAVGRLLKGQRTDKFANTLFATGTLAFIMGCIVSKWILEQKWNVMLVMSFVYAMITLFYALGIQEKGEQYVSKNH